jgi:hypothetical protein
MSRVDIIIREAREIEQNLRKTGLRTAADRIHSLIKSREASRRLNSGMSNDIRAYRGALVRAHDAMVVTKHDRALLTDSEWDEIIAQIRAVLATNFPGKGLPDA